MAEEADSQSSKIFHPQRPISRRTAEPILFLAERMATIDDDPVPREERVIDMLAEAIGLPTFRREPWFRDMTEDAAVQRISSELAKRATLVVLSLVLKADVKRKPSEHAYFTRMREMLGAEPITVPVDLEDHKKLAMEYFQEPAARH